MHRALQQLRRAPFTAAYTVLLLITGVWLGYAPAAQVATYEAAISTNLDNLAARPQVLVLSLTATDASYRWLFLMMVLAAIWMCETWLGTWRTVAVYVGSNILVTVLVALWISYALSAGVYDANIRVATDFGVSYGLNTLLGLLVARPRQLWANLALGIAMLGWLILQDPWGFREQSQFFGLGHILAALLGLALATGVIARRTYRAQAAAAAGDGQVQPQPVTGL